MNKPIYVVYHLLGPDDKKIEVGNPTDNLLDARTIAKDYLATNPRAKLSIVKIYVTHEEVDNYEPFKASLVLNGRLKYLYSEKELLDKVHELCTLGVPFKFIGRNDSKA